ncbi:MAG: hypothetical protein ABI443_10125 [Chthoniobacterales bacterium]
MILPIAVLGLSLATLQVSRAADPQPSPDKKSCPAASCDAPKGHGWGAKGQGRHGCGAGGHGNMGSMFAKKLNLTADQQEKVKAIFEASRPKMKAIMDDNMKQIRLILTPEQTKVLDDMKTLHQDKAALKKDNSKAKSSNQ